MLIYIYAAILLFTALLLSKNINLITYASLLFLVSAFYLLKLNLFITINSNSYYQIIFYKYSPYIFILSILLYLKYKVSLLYSLLDNIKKDKEITVKSALKLKEQNEQLLEHTKKLKKRIFQDSEDSNLIKHILNNLSLSTVNLYEMLAESIKRVFPDSKFIVYKYKNNDFVFGDSKLDNNISEYIKDMNQLISGKHIYKDKFMYPIIMKLSLNNKIIGCVIFNKVNILDITRTKLLLLEKIIRIISLLLNNSIIYQEQKNKAIIYKDYDIHNKKFLIQSIKKEINKSKRYNTIALLLYFSYNVNPNDLQDISKLLNKKFRLEDLFFYSDNKFYLLTSTKDCSSDNINIIFHKLSTIFKDLKNINTKLINKDTKSILEIIE